MTLPDVTESVTADPFATLVNGALSCAVTCPAVPPASTFVRLGTRPSALSWVAAAL